MLAQHEHTDTDTDGVGAVVHDGDTVAGIGLDDCRDPGKDFQSNSFSTRTLEATPTPNGSPSSMVRHHGEFKPNISCSSADRLSRDDP